MLTRESLLGYDFIVVALSGGKDSIACFLHLLDLGAPLSRIELWHHDVDGREGSVLMDWPCTRAYCGKFASAFGVPLFHSWKVGGFEREMLRVAASTAPIAFESPEGLSITGGRGPPNTRLKFPQVSADLSVRWCSAYLKIDVGAAALRNQRRFRGRKTLVVTGERAEESAARARYQVFETHRADNRKGRTRRHVDHWRPVHGWSEARIWDALCRYRVNPHPAYRLGFGRVSCAACIFGSVNQWATLRAIHEAQFRRIADYEERFGTTIRRRLNVVQLADSGTPYRMDEADIRAALSTEFSEPIVLPEGAWRLPKGAFGESSGPS